MKQYIIRKYVMANSASEALKKSKRMPPHEVYVDSAWLEKVRGAEFFEPPKRQMGFIDIKPSA